MNEETETNTMMQRETGMPELDNILRGGIPEGHIVMLSGDSGTGKTVLGMEWLFRGHQQYDEPGLYITLTESVTAALKNMKSMEFYRQSVTGSGIRFADLRSTVKLLELEEKDFDHQDVGEMIEAIEQLVEETGAKRVVLDSVTAIAYLLGDKELIRTFIFRLGAMLDARDVTTIMTSEVSDDGYSVFDVEEFIADGIIKLDHEPLNSDLRRTLQVMKMRGIGFDSRAVPFTITDNGFQLYVFQHGLDYPAPTTRISSGIAGLDEMVDGGLFEGSTSLVSGPTGSGKTLSSLYFICDALDRGETCLFVSFEESKQQLLRMARHFGWDLEEYEERDQLYFMCRRPGGAYPEKHAKEILAMADEHDVDRAVIDSLTAVRNMFPEQRFQEFTRRMALSLRKRGITHLVTSSHPSLIGTTAASRSNVSTLMDNIILLNYVEAESELKYTVAVLKTRSSDHERDLREYDITDNGLEIGGAMSGYEEIMTGSARKMDETVEEQIRDEFSSFLGPDGVAAFEEINEEGLTEDRLTAYIDDMVETDVLDAEDAARFKKRVCAILDGEALLGGVENADKLGMLERLFEEFEDLK